MTVYLVGAGPGEPDLLTLRAARLLGTADVIVHDRLVSDAILDMAAPWTELVNVGKDPNGHSVSQHTINEILREKAMQFETVVRLKGGDPYVFGRGGEESIALQTSGIAVEVVPGITSAIAGPAAAGIAVTHRGVSSGFTVVTGFQNPKNNQRLDWNAVARLGTTLVILMGASTAPEIRQRLIDGGTPRNTPVAIVHRATTSAQHTTRITLAELGTEPVKNPSIIVVGPAAALELATLGDSSTTTLASQGVIPWPS